MVDASACNVLMVCPRFEAETFWSFKKTTGRLRRLAKLLVNCSPRQPARRNLDKRELLHRIMANMPEPRDLFSRTLTQYAASNPAAARRILILLTLYMDVGPFSRDVIAQIEDMIAELGPVSMEPRANFEPVSSALAM